MSQIVNILKRPTHPMSKRIYHHRNLPPALSIAIIVRTKDRPQLLTRSLQSLAEQKRIPDEVIVVNDGGVAIDNIVSLFAALNIQLINNTHSQGRARAGNQGVQATHSQVIGFLDDDDRLLPDHLQRLEKARLLFDAKVAYSGCRLIQRELVGEEIVLQEKIIGQFNDPYDAERLRYENYIPLINLLIDRELWLQSGGFDESFEVFEDWDLLFRLSQQTAFYHLNRITTEYAVWGKSQITQATDRPRWQAIYRHFLEKHWLPLSTADQLQYLAEYWRFSQERRGILQDTRQDKQTLQLQILQTHQTLEQAQSQLTHYQQQLAQHQEQFAQLQQQYAQLQTDWQRKYEQLQIESIQLQADWRKKYEQLQLDWSKKYEQLQADWSKKYEQLQLDWQQKYQRLESEYAHLQADWTAKYQQLQSDYNQLQVNWISQYQQLQTEQAQQLAQHQAKWQQQQEQLQIAAAKKQSQLQVSYEQQEAHFKQQQAEMLAALAKQTQQYHELQTITQQDQTHYQALQVNLHELSKQIAVGLSQSTINKILQAQTGAYALATTTGGTLDDYHRLVDWIRGKAQHLSQLEQQLLSSWQPLPSEYQNLRQEINQLVQLILASRWPQVRRYAALVQALDQHTEQLFIKIQPVVTFSTHWTHQTGLIRLFQAVESNEIPPPRPLSAVYPTFMSIAGTPENPQFMESVHELGTIPFLLEAKRVLVFTVYCTLNHFFRIDLLLATRLRINTCQVRIIIRELTTKVPLRVIYLEALEILDNRFQPINFEPIIDSAGKTYQLEIDSPDANEHSGIAIWCHPQCPEQYPSQQLSTVIAQRSPQQLPVWAQQSLLAVPLATPLNVTSAPHLFILGGITAATPVISLHVWLMRLAQALQSAQTSGQVIVYGQLSQEVVHYCRHHQWVTLEGSVQFELATLLNGGKQQMTPTTEYLWCCDLNALPQFDIVTRALEIFATHSQAALLVPLETYADGKIRAGYAALKRDGVLQTPAAGTPSDHPYHGYRRLVEAASSLLVILKTGWLSQLEMEIIRAYYTPMYQVTELIWQLKQHHQQTLYQAVLCYEQDQPYPSFTEQDYLHDNQYFYQRWAQHLPTQFAPFSRQLEAVLNPQQQPTVLVIDATLPMYDEDSGSLRLYTLLKIWVSLGYQITFFPDNLDSQFKYRYALEALGIEVFHGQYGIADALAYRQFDFALISRVEIGHRYIPFIRLLSPRTVIFYDTVDIHYIREQRQAEIENNPQLAAKAQTTKRKELSNCILADRVITVTQDDANHLQQELPNLTFSVIPNIHISQPLPETTWKQRDGLVFVGNYNHHPNQDAVCYFVEAVLPQIQAQLPDVCLYLIGSNIKDHLTALANEHVKITGWAEQLEPELAQRRVFVSYLRYGAGMKGKLGQALSLGLPVVTTTIGAEGMGLVNEETALIADDPDSFAQAVCRLYTDSHLWEKLARQGREYIEQHYGESAVREKLRCMLIG
ncbi:glycosyltransferase [Thioploca ingrica]|uniref:Glycosyltransferase n=1 Tax=Thioploca ingrica TaxID=40754 RepID=A0A090AIX6_9GAMM|nr:glycosyltransferase [Thioploca ingrica]